MEKIVVQIYFTEKSWPKKDNFLKCSLFKWEGVKLDNVDILFLDLVFR